MIEEDQGTAVGLVNTTGHRLLAIGFSYSQRAGSRRKILSFILDYDSEGLIVD